MVNAYHSGRIRIPKEIDEKFYRHISMLSEAFRENPVSVIRCDVSDSKENLLAVSSILNQNGVWNAEQLEIGILAEDIDGCISGFRKISFKNKLIEMIARTSTSRDMADVIGSIIRTKDAGIDVILTIVVDSDISGLPAALKNVLASPRGVRHIRISLDPGNAKDKFRISGIEKDISACAETIIDSGKTFILENFPLCMIKGLEEYSSEVMHILGIRKQYGEDIDPRREQNIRMCKECTSCPLRDICIGFDSKYVLRNGTEEIIRSFESKESITERAGDVPADLTDNTSFFTRKVNDDLDIFDQSLAKKSNKNNIYDTYSHYLMDGSQENLSKEYIMNCWKMLVSRIKEGKESDNVNLYVHFPFCISSCDYCIYPSVKCTGQDQINNYLRFLDSEMERYSPILKGIKLKSLSIGGGTPSLMSDKQMDFLLSSIHRNFCFDKGAEKGTEFNPNSTTKEKIDVLDRYGFNKLSIGVQSLKPEVLKTINRGYQTFDSVKRAVSIFKGSKIGYLNIDLLIGLKSDTADNFLYTAEEVLKLGPNIITVYPIKTNDNYLRTRYNSPDEFFRFYYPLFDDIRKRLPEIIKRYGYTSSMDFDKLSYVHPFDLFRNNGEGRKNTRFTYSNFKPVPYSNLGIGFYSQSNVNDIINYIFMSRKNDNKSTLFLKEFSTDPYDYFYFVCGFLKNYSRVKFITSSISESFSVSREEYQSIFKSDILDDFPYAIKALLHLGRIRVSDNRITFNANSELELYRYMLFFVGRKIVREKIAQWTNT